MQPDMLDISNDSSEAPVIKYSSLKERMRNLRMTMLKIGRKRTSLMSIGLLLVGLAAGVGAFIYARDLRSGASSTGVDLSVVPATKQMNPDETFTWDIFVNTHDHAVTTIKVDMKYDSNLFDFVSIVPGTAMPKTLGAGVGINGRAAITLVTEPQLIDFGPPEVWNIPTFKGTGTLAKITLKAKAGIAYSQTNISFNPGAADNTGTVALTKELGSTNVIGDLTAGAITIGTAPASPVPSPLPSPSVGAASPVPSVVPSPTPSPSPRPSPVPPSPTPSPVPSPIPSPIPSPVASSNPSPVASAAVTGWTMVDDRSTMVTYSASWVAEAQQGTYQNTQHYSSTKDASAVYTFTGTGVRYIAAYTPQSGIANIYVDNVLQTSVNTYASAIRGEVVAYEKTGLTYGSHTIKVVNQATSGKPYTVVDAFAYTGSSTTTPSMTPVPTPPPTGDTVSIVSARVMSSYFKNSLVKIEVIAKSSAQPGPTLTVLNYGTMKYSSSTGTYVKTFWVVKPWPTQVTVESSLGGRADATVVGPVAK